MSEDRAFRFWCGWLFWALVSIALFGASIALVDTRYWPFFPEAINAAFWGTAEMPAEVVRYHRFTHAVAGATIASWAVALAFVARIPFRRRERWAWWCVVASLVAWFPLDTSMSLYLGAWPNALFNASTLLIAAPPLVFTYRDFTADHAAQKPS